MNENTKTQVISNKQLVGVGAAAGFLTLLWSKIVMVWGMIVSIFVESISMNEVLPIKIYLHKNAKYKFYWDKQMFQESLFLKKYKTRRYAYFIAYSKGIYFNREWGGIVFLNGSNISYFRWNNFIQKFSKDIYKDMFNMSVDETRNNFYIVNVSGDKPSFNTERGNRDEPEPELPTASSSSDRLTIEAIKCGVIIPLFFDADDFGFDDVKETIFEDYYITKDIDNLLNVSKKWLMHEKWFKDHNITWKRGFCLHGKPGCGKSSFVLRLAKFLGLPLYVYNLSTLTNSELIQKWNSMQKPCIALFEDFDSVFEGRKFIADVGQMQQKLTFDTVLNIIDGVNSCDGTLTIITTNHLDKLDEAILRPGRIDNIVEISALGHEGKAFIAKKILNGHTELYEKLLQATTESESNADFENKCIQIALKEFWKD